MGLVELRIDVHLFLGLSLRHGHDVDVDLFLMTFRVIHAHFVVTFLRMEFNGTFKIINYIKKKENNFSHFSFLYFNKKYET